MNLVAIDTETGGAGPNQCETHAMIQLGAYYRTADGTGHRFCVSILPAARLIIDPRAAAVNGYSPEEWERRSAVSEQVAVIRFFQFILEARWRLDSPDRRIRFLAHNAGHDQGFLNSMLDRCGFMDEVYAPRDILATSDAPAAARWQCSQSAMGLLRDAGIIDTPGVSLDDGVAWMTGRAKAEVVAARGTHDAGADAESAWLLYHHMVATLIDMRAMAATYDMLSAPVGKESAGILDTPLGPILGHIRGRAVTI